jgi:hypothetical protein
VFVRLTREFLELIEHRFAGELVRQLRTPRDDVALEFEGAQMEPLRTLLKWHAAKRRGQIEEQFLGVLDPCIELAHPRNHPLMQAALTSMDPNAGASEIEGPITFALTQVVDSSRGHVA